MKFLPKLLTRTIFCIYIYNYYFFPLTIEELLNILRESEVLNEEDSFDKELLSNLVDFFCHNREEIMTLREKYQSAKDDLNLSLKSVIEGGIAEILYTKKIRDLKEEDWKILISEYIKIARSLDNNFKTLNAVLDNLKNDVYK